MILSMEVASGMESFDPIIDERLFLGNLTAAESPRTMARLGITHIVSVCPDLVQAAAPINHLVIPIEDNDESNILQYLTNTCAFIHAAIRSGGKVFLHCVMGISRSATVVCAYLMFARRISAAGAIEFLRKCRPKSRPNYNFTRQLLVFSACEYQVASNKAPYRLWLQRQTFDIANGIRVVDAMRITDGLFLSFNLPSRLEQSSILLDHLGITHIVSINPDQVTSSPNPAALCSSRVHKHFIAPYTSKEALLLSLPLLCKFIETALQSPSSRVILHSMDETRAGLALCAYAMFSLKVGALEALALLQDCVPSFETEPSFLHQIELFASCQHIPTSRHPLVRAWVSGKPRSVVDVGTVSTPPKFTKTHPPLIPSMSVGA
ncbi:Phosphatases II [Mycena indigotica]|uniref:protein-tyrosine-phosphatase n=1 Tax=Mycena indigotica TaxID=2126181 RepID=A0A8H6W8C2_9AGAR|nr:Phosphatases II [Mycena indigotica]KAF7309524.1 Phosphatases II [Mycena indigotica]